MTATFTDRAIALIKKIPKGKVATYGQIAAMAGDPRGARQVVRILNIYHEKEKLPWFRIINREGKISLPPGGGYELQKSMLENEGVVFDSEDKINLEKFLWSPKK
jgi:methylated-DNA-protein-cysteine methyltransferase related protein